MSTQDEFQRMINTCHKNCDVIDGKKKAVRPVDPEARDVFDPFNADVPMPDFLKDIMGGKKD